MRRQTIQRGFWAAMLVALVALNAHAQDRRPIDPGKARVVEHWTSERRASAIPRNLVIDPRGLGYLRQPNGVLVPYGHQVAAQTPARQATPWPFGKPSGGGGGGDTTPPVIADMNPAPGATIPAAYTFSATVTDLSGVQSVSFKVQKGSGLAQSFAATQTSQDTWTVSLQGFTDGDWSWQVVAKDAAGKGGNTSQSTWVTFSVNSATSGGGGGGAGTVTNAAWTGGGKVQTAAGRIYFEMPTNSKRTRWVGYVCSGTVASDAATDRSIIITAAHCVYDDANKAFARNVMFIPDQDRTAGTRTDGDCTNDPLGCWVPDFGVVDKNWTTNTFPNNVAWDYAFYVVPKSGAHKEGFADKGADLEVAAGVMTVSFGTVKVDDTTSSGSTSPDFTHALGYSYSEDPNFMYCAEKMTTIEAFNWWLPSCGLSGGASGGPWLQPISGGNGPIISVNSWGYTSGPGMAGPKLVGTTAKCVFDTANDMGWPLNLDNNRVANCAAP